MPRIIRKTTIEIEDPTDEDVLTLTNTVSDDEGEDAEDQEDDGEDDGEEGDKDE